MSTPAPTDEGLMALLSDGEQSALAELVRRYQNDIFRFCLHYVRDVERAKEMPQETFIRVYVARHSSMRTANSGRGCCALRVTCV